MASRRFGLSLGIDLSPNEKSCNFDCIYCELKKAAKKKRIENPPSVEDIISDVKEALRKHPNIEVLTVTANGEPTLYPYLKELVAAIREKFPQKLMILSNGSTVYKKEIQETLKDFDTVKLSLDSVLEKSFVKIDRPMDRDLKKIISGIVEFSKVFKNELVVEILVVKSINDTKEDFQALNSVLEKINPSKVDIGTIDRPPAYSVEAVSREVLEKLALEIKNQNINIVARKKSDTKSEYTEEEILNTTLHRPLCEEEVHSLFDKTTREKLFKMLTNGLIKRVEKNNQFFYEKTEK